MNRQGASEWLFDLGNTRLKCAPLRTDGCGGNVRAMAHGGATGRLAAVDMPQGEVAYVASVASVALRDALLESLTGRFQRIHVARTLPSCGGMRIAYPQPERLGVDRFLSLLAVHGRRMPALVVSVGTALTVDLIDAAGQHRGGRIAPSPALMREALHARAAQLPVEGGDYTEFAIDTADALASGCEGAALALVQRSLAQGESLLGGMPALLLHGGGADALAPHLPGATVLHGLVLAGLAQWARIGAAVA